MADLNETLQEIAKNETSKPKSSLEGTLIAYSSLVIMALLPIFFGAFRSVAFSKKQKDSGEKLETMTTKDAAKFPFIASAALLGLYVLFKIFSKEYINLLLATYFFGLGVMSLTYILSSPIKKFLPQKYNIDHNILYKRGTMGSDETVIFDFTIPTEGIIAFILCTMIGSVYLYNKHWVLNNLFGLAFALNGVEMLHLNSIVIGCILLGGLFVYDIFWVFATDVMVTVAKSFEAPIKLVFPQDILENWLESSNFAMLGLGDIVIPGIFIALLLRFDESLQRGRKVYFYSGFIAYFFGLVMTIFIMSYFKHAQPALLYLVPACIGVPILTAIVQGDLKALFVYEDHPTDSEGSEASTPSVSKESTPSETIAQEVKKEK